MSELGPDLWGNAPADSAPNVDKVEFLGKLAAAAADWKPARDVVLWNEKIGGVQLAIGDAIEALPLSDVFSTRDGLVLYNVALGRYQETKDAIAFGAIDVVSEADLHPKAPEWIDKLLAALRALGFSLLGAAVVLIVLAILIRMAIRSRTLGGAG